MVILLIAFTDAAAGCLPGNGTGTDVPFRHLHLFLPFLLFRCFQNVFLFCLPKNTGTHDVLLAYSTSAGKSVLERLSILNALL